MSSLFKSKQQVSTQTSDPYATMPDWMKAAFERDDAFRQGILDKGAGIAGELEDDPRTILGLSGGEENARELLWDDYDEAEARSKALLAGLPGGYEDKYTDDVVNTTLAGMQRQADRDRLAREGKAAAVGGTSNTRAAVADAVAGQLTGMNMAEMEAKLRSDATRWGAETGLAETELADQIGSGMFNRGTTTSGALGSIAEQERALEQAQLDENRNAPRDALSWLSSLFSGTQYDKGPTGSTQTSSQPGNSPFQNILGAAASLGGAWLQSDEETKQDIVDLDPDKALSDLMGLRPAEYQYREGYGHREDRHLGLIAQSAEGISGATRMGENGKLELTAYPVLATVVSAVQQLARERGYGGNGEAGGAGLRETDRHAA